MKGKWTIAEARKRFSEVIESAAAEPQPIYKRERLVAALVDPETFAEFLRWKEEKAGRSIASAFVELRELCKAEDYEFYFEERQDRQNVFDPGDEH